MRFIFRSFWTGTTSCAQRCYCNGENAEGMTILLVYVSRSSPPPFVGQSPPNTSATLVLLPVLHRAVVLSGSPSDRRAGLLRGGSLTVGLDEAVETRAAQQDLGRELAGDVLEEVGRHVGKVGAEMRVVRRDAHPVGADEPRR